MPSGCLQLALGRDQRATLRATPWPQLALILGLSGMLWSQSRSTTRSGPLPHQVPSGSMKSRRIRISTVPPLEATRISKASRASSSPCSRQTVAGPGVIRPSRRARRRLRPRKLSLQGCNTRLEFLGFADPRDRSEPRQQRRGGTRCKLTRGRQIDDCACLCGEPFLRQIKHLSALHGPQRGQASIEQNAGCRNIALGSGRQQVFEQLRCRFCKPCAQRVRGSLWSALGVAGRTGHKPPVLIATSFFRVFRVA